MDDQPLGRWSLIMEIDEGFAVGMSPAELSAEQLLASCGYGKAKRKAMAGSNSTQEV
ncbi:hypothetical protein ACNKHT_13770 [Shigella flexneri]